MYVLIFWQKYDRGQFECVKQEEAESFKKKLETNGCTNIRVGEPIDHNPYSEHNEARGGT